MSVLNTSYTINYVFGLILDKCRFNSYTLNNRCKQTIGFLKKDYYEFTCITEDEIRDLLLVPKYLFENLYKQIESFSTKADKSEILNMFTEDIYGIWVYIIYTPEYAKSNKEQLKYAYIKLDANNIDDFISDYIECFEKTNTHKPRKCKAFGFDNNKQFQQTLDDKNRLTEEKKKSLQKMADYLKSKMNEDTINSQTDLVEVSIESPSKETTNEVSKTQSKQTELAETKNEEQKSKPKLLVTKLIRLELSSDSESESETSSDNESDNESESETKPEVKPEVKPELKPEVKKSHSQTQSNTYTWNEVGEYKEINLNVDKIPDEIYKDVDEEYTDLQTLPDYKIDNPEELNKITTDKQYTIDSPEIKELINNYVKDDVLDINYLKVDDIGCKYHKCDNFLNNIIGRKVNTREIRPYAYMIMKVRLGMMPYKRMNRGQTNDNFNAFCSSLTEIKSVDEKQHILDTSIKYDQEFNHNYYKYNELCEYIITDYQRLVFDIDVESKKTFNKNKEDEYTIEYSLSEETIKKINKELLIIQFIYEICKNVNPKSQLYAFIQYGNKNYWTDEDKEEYKTITNKIFEGFNEKDCHYITEFNSRSTKLLSIHFSISGIVYDRKDNTYLRNFLNGNISTSYYVNGKQVINDLEFLDTSIYVDGQRAWRFAYSCKQKKKECELEPWELQKHKTILYNLFAYPEKDDIEINLCDKLNLNIDTYDKIKTICKQKNSRLSEIYQQINSVLKTIDFNDKSNLMKNKNDITEFVNNRVDLPEEFECLIKHPVIVEKLHYLQQHVQGYPNIFRNVLKFVNDCRIMYIDQDNIYNLLLTIDYYHTDGTPNRSQSMIRNLVKYGFKHEIYHTMQLSTDITNDHALKLLRYRYWLKEDLIKFLKRLIFMVDTKYVLKVPTSSKKGIELKTYTEQDLKHLFNFPVKVFTPYYYNEKGKRCSKEDYVTLSVELSSIPLSTFIINVDLHRYNEINVCVTENTLKQTGTISDGFKSYNKYDVQIGYDADNNPVYDCMKKHKCVHNLTFKDRPEIINEIFKNLLYSPNITDEEFEIRKNYFEALFAFKIQNPDLPVQISPIICGEQGIGKNTYFKILSGFLNGWCEDELSWDIEMSNFNAQQQDNIIRCYNEVKSNKAVEGKLKALITDLMESINEKNEKRISKRNLSLKVFLTNERQNYLLSNTGNRRFLYYTPPTSSSEGKELSKKIYNIDRQVDKKIIDDYKNYIFKLDLSNFKIKNIVDNEVKYELFNPMDKNTADYLDDMLDFQAEVDATKDTTTQFLDKMVEVFKIPEYTNKKHLIPTSFIIAVAKACKCGYSTIEDPSSNDNLETDGFMFDELTIWFGENMDEKLTWNANSIAKRLIEAQSSYVTKKDIRIKELRKKIENIKDKKLKDLLCIYYKPKISGYLG